MRDEDADFAGRWAALSAEVLVGVADWRAQHARATLAEIEAEVDARLAQVRARLVEHVALRSAATAWEAAGEAPRCPDCAAPLRPRGRKTRRVTTQGGAELTLRRAHGVCPRCGRALFPPG